MAVQVFNQTGCTVQSINRKTINSVDSGVVEVLAPNGVIIDVTAPWAAVQANVTPASTFTVTITTP